MSVNDLPSRQALEQAEVIAFTPEQAERVGFSARQRRLALDGAVMLASAAALAHASMAPEDWRWWTASALFFAMLAVGQGLLALALVRRPVRDRLLAIGVWGTVSVIAVFVISRTAGIPFAPPAPGSGSYLASRSSIVPAAEKYVGAFEIFTVVVEILLVLILTGLMTKALRQRTATRLLWVALLLWGLAGLSVL